MTVFAKMRSPKRGAQIRDGAARMSQRRSDVSPRTPDLRSEQERLIARFKRQLDKFERLGGRDRARKIRDTLAELIAVERRIEDPLADLTVTDSEIQARLTLMRRGAGIEVPR